MPLQLILCPGRGRYPPVRRHNPRGELDWREPAMRRDDCVGFEVHGSGACDQRQAWLLCGGQPTGTGRGGTGTTASSTRLSSRGFHAVCTPQKAERGGGMCRRAPHRGCRCLQGCARRLAAGLSPAEAPILCRSRPRRGLRRRPHCAPASGSAAALRPPTTFASTPRCTQTSGHGRLRRPAIGAPTQWGRVLSHDPAAWAPLLSGFSTSSIPGCQSRSSSMSLRKLRSKRKSSRRKRGLKHERVV